MDVGQEKLRRWSFGLAAGTSILVGILSGNNGVSLFWLVLRAAVTFALVYALTWGSIVLFFKSGVPQENGGKSVELHTPAPERGRVLDVAVGADDAGELPPIPMPGQVNVGLNDGLPDSATQAEIVRRMGWGGQ